jgi:hypothetical protein
MIGSLGKAPAGVTGALPDCSRKVLPYGASLQSWLSEPSLDVAAGNHGASVIRVLQGGTGGHTNDLSKVPQR